MNNTVIKSEFKKIYGKNPDKLFSCGGRFEILGNHTDHNHGLCLAATCDLCIVSGISKRDDNIVKFVSKGYPEFEISLSDLKVKEKEKNTSNGLIRGVAYYLKNLGYSIGGFNAYLESNIFKGAGVSSSAAFELLIGQIFNELFNDNKIDRITLCKAGQYSENNYFGKASGLLDQIGVGFGNIVSIDFKDIKNPKVEEVSFPFDDLHFVIVNTGGSHAELSDLYSAIPTDMYNAAKAIGHKFLIEGSEEEILAIKDKLSDIEFTRAMHFYGENKRVQIALEALKNNDEETFLEQINGSRVSSTNLLKNMMVGNEYVGSPLEACDLAMEIMDNHGAIKINGGGFAGSVIACVPTDYLSIFFKKMKAKYGDESVCEVSVRKSGPISL